jgi:hypothetical protein
MHPLLIDWLRKNNFNADTAFATKRWKLAQGVAGKSSRKDVLQLLRAFLFENSSPEVISGLTRKFLEFDKEYPASNNKEDVRLQAGVVMVAGFEQRTFDGDALALGLRAAAFPAERCKPAHTGIIEEALKYIEQEALTIRPTDFDSDHTSEIVEKLEAYGVSVTDAEQRKTAQEALADKLDDLYRQPLRRLTEEIGLLWWLLGGFSPTLKQETGSIDATAYALIAAAEAAERTQLLPPPPSIYAILRRALASCKGAKRGKTTFKDFVAEADSTWRKKFVEDYSVADCADLVPFATALTKTNEAGDADILTKVIPNTCPGVSSDMELAPWEAAQQFYNELIFLKALSNRE